MKKKVLAITFAAATVFAVGCKPSPQPTPNDKPVNQGVDATARQVEKVQNETAAAAKEINEYAYAQRAEFADKMKVQLADIKKEMDMLAARLENASEPTKTEGKAKLEALKVKVASLDKQLDGIKDASESSWNDVKSGFQKTYDDVKDSFQQARQWLSDKIAP
ncbi:MAG TPA: hypothetical protein VGH19_12450 [Verrucomicrobiae bacterium]